jgi:hypothetical protein
MANSKSEVAAAFAAWFKTYSTNEAFEWDSEGFKQLIKCAAEALCCQNNEDCVCDDEVMQLVQALQKALMTNAVISLLRDGAVVPGLKDGDLCVGPID